MNFGRFQRHDFEAVLSGGVGEEPASGTDVQQALAGSYARAFHGDSFRIDGGVRKTFFLRQQLTESFGWASAYAPGADPLAVISAIKLFDEFRCRTREHESTATTPAAVNV